MIISQTIIRNEKGRFLDRWLKENSPHFDKMIIYDDASDDGVYFNSLNVDFSGFN